MMTFAFFRGIEFSETMADWSFISLQLKLIKIGARVVRHACAITSKLAEAAVTVRWFALSSPPSVDNECHRYALNREPDPN
jgi:hypothetical protein